MHKGALSPLVRGWAGAARGAGQCPGLLEQGDKDRAISMLPWVLVHRDSPGMCRARYRRLPAWAGTLREGLPGLVTKVAPELCPHFCCHLCIPPVCVSKSHLNCFTRTNLISVVAGSRGPDSTCGFSSGKTLPAAHPASL